MIKLKMMWISMKVLISPNVEKERQRYPDKHYSDISPDFPARQLIGRNHSSAREIRDDQVDIVDHHEGIEDDVMHQFTFKDQFSSPFTSSGVKPMSKARLDYFNEEDLHKTDRIDETGESSKFR